MRNSHSNSVSIVTRLQDGQLRFDSWQGLEIITTTVYRLALGPTMPPIQQVLWALSPG